MIVIQKENDALHLEYFNAELALEKLTELKIY